MCILILSRIRFLCEKRRIFKMRELLVNATKLPMLVGEFVAIILVGYFFYQKTTLLIYRCGAIATLVCIFTTAVGSIFVVHKNWLSWTSGVVLVLLIFFTIIGWKEGGSSYKDEDAIFDGE